MIEHNFKNPIRIVSIQDKDYWHFIEAMSIHEIRGGRTYDGLIAFSGYLSQIQNIVTLNPNHFDSFSFLGLIVISPNNSSV